MEFLDDIKVTLHIEGEDEPIEMEEVLEVPSDEVAGEAVYLKIEWVGFQDIDQRRRIKQGKEKIFKSKKSGLWRTLAPLLKIEWSFMTTKPI